MGLVIDVTNMQKTKDGADLDGWNIWISPVPNVTLYAHANQQRVVLLLAETYMQPLTQMP